MNCDDYREFTVCVCLYIHACTCMQFGKTELISYHVHIGTYYVHLVQVYMQYRGYALDVRYIQLKISGASDRKKALPGDLLTNLALRDG